MKVTLSKVATTFAFVFGFVGGAHAATSVSNSVKYFDENGLIVGQQILLCNNGLYHAGNVHTAYVIKESTACGGNTLPFDYIVPGTIIIDYTLPGALSISGACAIAECEHSGVTEPKRLMDKGWTWEGGWQ